MNHSTLFALIALISISGCATKTVCANGGESFRPVLDPAASCKIRIRQVLVGTDVKVPASISMDGGAVTWSYGWADSEFKDGQIVLGHMTLKPELATPDQEKK